jgi:ATP-grasp domain
MVASLQPAGLSDMSLANNRDAHQVGSRRLRESKTRRSIVAGRAPLVLLITAYRWPTATRLALALHEAGFAVEAACPLGHSLARVSFVSHAYRFNPLRPGRSIHDAINASKADFIIPTDDIAGLQLRKLYEQLKASDPDRERLRSLIARSLGDPENYSVIYSRSHIASVALSVGVLCPSVTDIHKVDDLARQIEAIGFPIVLKTDGSSGGAGVEIVNDRADARRAFERLAAPPNVALTLKRSIVDGDANLVLQCLQRTQKPVSVQRFIDGRRANVAAACWQGKVLAAVCVEVLASNDATSSSTVVRVFSHPGMSQAAEKMVRAFKLSGLCGFDFILDAADDSPYLIDFNPRATQTCHLVSFEGKDLLSLLAAKLRGMPLPEKVQESYHGPVVLYPHGFVYDPQGPYSNYIHTDLPPRSPEFVKIGLEFRREKNKLLAKAVRLARRKWSMSAPKV